MTTHVETGIVTASDGNTVKVRVVPAHSGSCEACGASGRFCVTCGGNARERLMTLPAEPDLKVGCPVEVEISEPSPGLVGLILFGFPMALGLFGALAGLAVSSIFSTKLTTTVLAGTVLGLLAAFSVIRRLEVFWETRRTFQFRVVKHPCPPSVPSA